MNKIFIDGSAGTTGLRIRERLQQRSDITLLSLPEELRKDTEARRCALNEADIVFLCLPDDAARESVSMTENPNTVVIDTSTAHRVHPDFTYGFPEIGNLRAQIIKSKRIANPGCHASGFIALVAPLVEAGIIPDHAHLGAYSLTGYSGGGKKMIAEYESDQPDPLYAAPRMYGLGQTHKHLPEMVHYTNLRNAPVFCPVVASFYSGMEVTVPLFASEIKGKLRDIQEIYRCCYGDEASLVHYTPDASENGFLSAVAFGGRDDMQVTVCGNEERILLVARYDNLGKGASGAAIQNMNLVLGVKEDTGLVR